MNEISVGFSQDSDATVFNKASAIHAALTMEPGLTYFPTTSPTMAAFKTEIDSLQAALSLETTPSNAALRKAARTKLVTSLQRLAADLELKADGNLVHLAATGFELKSKPTRSTTPLPAPLNLRVKPTGIAGQALCKCAAVAHADAYECAWTQDPVNGPWTAIPPVTSSQNMLFTDLQRGKDTYFRVRAIGPNGPSGWSDVATMMVV